MSLRRASLLKLAVVSALAVAALAVWAPPAGAAPARSLTELQVSLYGIAAGVDPLQPIVPKQTASGLRIVVKAGGKTLSASEVARLLGGPFEVQAELSGPGLSGAIALPRTGPDAIPSPDPLILTFPGLPHAGEYDIANIRLVRAGRAVLDVLPRRVTLRVIEQILVTSVVTRPLSLDEIRERGVVLDASAYLGFEFAITLKLESTPVQFRFPVVFDRQGVPIPIPLEPPPEPLRSVVSAPQLVPVLLRPSAPEMDPDGAPPDYGLDDLPGYEGAKIPSLLVIPGSVGYLKQFFSTQLIVGNGAPAGSGLLVRNVTGTLRLPPGADGQVGTADDPLALPLLDAGPQSPVVVVKGDGGTADLEPGAFGRAELTLRGEREGRHDVDFDIRAVLDGLPVGPVPLEGSAHGVVLVRNAYFDVTFTVPTVVRADEEFSVFATVTNIGQGAGNDVKMSIDASRLSGARLLSAGTQTIETLVPGDAATLEYRFRSEVTGEVVASYLRFDTSGGAEVTGRLNFTLGVGERRVAMSPDTLVLPSAVRALPPHLVRAAMRVLGQAWSAATAASLPPGVERPSTEAVFRKGLAVAEAGLRVELGQPLVDALRDLLLDLHGAGSDPGFDQVLRETGAGRDLDRLLGLALEPAALAGALEYEGGLARIAASGPPFLSLALENQGPGGMPAEVHVRDGAGRETDLAARGVPTGVVVSLGAGAGASRLGFLSTLADPPYTLEISGTAEGVVGLSLTLPGDADARRARLDGIAVSQGSRHRLVYDPARPGLVDLETDLAGDGTYESRQPVALTLLASEGPQLVAAATIGPETLDGASPFGTYAALLFDRVVSEADAASPGSYEIADNSVLAAKRQLSGRLVFVAFEQPEGPLVGTRLAVQGVRDERGRGGVRQEQSLGSRLSLPGAVVSGRVLQANGTPVPDAIVTYLNSSAAHAEGRWDCTISMDSAVSAQRTDAAGRFALRYVPQSPCGSPFRLETQDPDTGAVRGVKTYVRVNGQRLSLDLVLIGHGKVTGQVRHATGAPAAGARVRVVSVTDSQIGSVTTTDDQGRYAVERMTVGAVTVTAVHGANLGRSAGRLDVAGGTTTVNVTLDGNVDITGSVRKLEDGVLTPVPGVDVVYYVGSTPLGVSVTDSQGQYRLLGVPAGPYRLDAGLNQRDRTSLVGNSVAGQKLVQNLVIEIRDYSTYGTVKGTVKRLDGSPVADAWVSDNVVSTRADSLGQYELLGVALSASPRTVQAVSPDGRRSGSTSVVLTLPGQVVNGADIQLSGVGAVAFQVVDAQGAPVAGASVGLQGSCLHPCGCRFSNTDAQGIARFSELSFGPVSARAVVQGVPGRWDTALGSATVASEEVAAGGVIRMSGFGSVTGVVTNPSGSPAHGASVELEGKQVQIGGGVCGLETSVLGRVTTDTQGRFSFENVHVGGVWARASSVVFPRTVATSGSVAADGDSEHLELRLVDTMAGILSGTVWMPDGLTGAGPDVEVTANGPIPDVTVRTDAQGHFSFAPVLPAGGYVLTVRDARAGGTGSVVQSRIWLQPAQSAQHDLRLKAKGPVRVSVVDGSGEPVAGSVVRVELVEGDFPYRRYEGTIDGPGDQPLEFPAVFEGDFSVKASDSFARGGRASGSVPPHGQPVDVKVSLTTTGRVAGRFLWADRVTPLPLGTVTLVAGGRTIGQQTTASEGEIGSYAFDYVPAGPVQLHAQDPRSGRTGTANATLTTEGELLTLDVVTYAVGRVEGTVTLNDLPAPSADVSLRSGQYAVRVTADGDGFYAVDGVPEGTVYATADLGGGFLAGSAQGALSGEGSTLSLPVSLRGAATIVGQLKAAGGAGPGAISLVTLSGAGRSQTTTTDTDGSFRFDLVPEGSIVLAVESLQSIDCVRESLDVEGGETAALTLTLRGVGAVEGEARSSAGPVAGAITVTGTGPGCVGRQWNLSVGPSGQFRIPELIAGPVSASFWTPASGTPRLSANDAGEVLPAQTTTLALLVEPSGGVRGTVKHEDGTAAVGSQVRIDAGGGRYALTQTGADGVFLAAGVPAGPITIRVTDASRGGVALVTGLSVVENGTLQCGEIALLETPLAVVSVTPAEGALDVAVSQPIQLVFNAPIAPVGGVTLRGGGRYLGFNPSLSPDQRTLTLNPGGGGWPDSVEIVVEAGPWVTDVYGRRLPSAYQSRFRTLDLSPPRVISVTPPNRAIQVDIGAGVAVKFDEPLTTTGDLQPLVRLSSAQGVVAGTVAASDVDSLLFTPAAPLASNLTYSVTVNGASDLLGHVQTTAFTSSFMTPDADPPLLRLTSPQAGGWTKQKRPTIRVSVEDALAGPDASRALLRLDGLKAAPVRSSDQFSHVPAYDLADGLHTVEASAHDRAGNQGDLVASFRVDSQPPAAPVITSPTSDQVVSGIVTLAGTASDAGSGVAHLGFLRDGQWIGEATAASGLSVSWNTAASSEGAHLITANAVDVAGNSGPASPAVRVIVNNQPLAVAFTSPAAGFPVKTQVSVAASPSEPVARVEFRAGSGPAVIDVTAPYEAVFDLSAEPEGNLTLTATAVGLAPETAVATRTILIDRTPPAAPDPTRVHAEATAGSALVLGVPGAVEPESLVRVVHSVTGAQNERASFPGGSFAMRIAAEVGETVLVTLTDVAGNVSDPLALGVAEAPSDEPSVALEGLQIWTRSGEGVTADSVGRVSRWADRSGRGNHLDQGAREQQPRRALDPVSGMEVLRFDGSNDVMKFTTRLDGSIRSVFAVLKQGSASASWRQLLGDAVKDDFYPGWITLWAGSGWTSPAVVGGQTYLNGVAVDGVTTNRPQTMSVLSLLTTAGVTADRLFHGRSNYAWIGDIAELVVYDQPLTRTSRKLVEDYLARRYALYVPTVATPLVSPDGATFTGSTAVTLTAPTPGSVVRYTLDGSQPTESSPLYLEPLDLTHSAILKARAFRPGHIASAVATAGFVSSADFSPMRLPGLAVWVRGDAGVGADGGGRVSEWRDQSGQGNHLVQPVLASQPLYVAGEVNGLPVLRFDGSNDVMPFTTRLNGSIRAVFAVLKQRTSSTWRVFMGDAVKDDFYPGWTNLWNGTGWTSPAILLGETWLNGMPVDGSATERPQTMSVLSVLTTAGVTADRLFHGKSNYPWIGDIAELVVYTEPLTSSQRKSVEDYLALKYAAYVATAGAPEFAPNGGTFTGSVEVSLSSPTPDAAIRYTTDGSEPTGGSTLYTDPLTLTATTTVRARAYRAGMSPSPVALAAFTNAADFTPASVPGLALWTRADADVVADTAGRVSAWRDQSGQGNHLVQPVLASQPLYVAGGVNGLPVLRFDGTNDVMPFTNRLDGTIRAVFAVLKQNTSSTWRVFMGDAVKDDFYPGWTNLWNGTGWTSPAILLGETWLNGMPVDGSATERPQTMSVLSVLTTAGVTADRLFHGKSNYPWIGDIAELVVYTEPLTSSQRKSVEDYLALKYAPYVATAGAPEFAPNGGTFTGSVEVSLSSPTPDAEIRYTTDGGEPTDSSLLYTGPFTLTATTTVRARAYRAGMNASPMALAAFTNAADFTPASLPGLALWTRADADVVADTANRVSAWRDQSGQGNHLVQPVLASQPLYVAGEVNGLPVLRFDGSNDVMPFTTRLNGSIRAVFAVLKQRTSSTWRVFMGDAVKDDFYPGWTNLWNGTGWTSPAILLGETWLNGMPVDGSATERPQAMSVLSVLTTAGVTADRLFHGKSNYPWIGDIAELVVYTEPLTSSQRKSVEDYLALKYAAYVATAGAPEFAPNGGTFTGSVEVSLSSPTPGAEIRYTTNGSEPTDGSTLYAGPFTLSATTTVRARAFRSGMNPSPVALASFTKHSDFTPSDIPGLALWTRADADVVADTANRVSAWRDQSGQGNHLVQPVLASQPLYVASAVNGLPVLRFDGSNDVLPFTNRLDGTIRAVFAVLKQSTSSTWRVFMGDAVKDDFYPGWTNLWGGTGWTSPAILLGETWLNGIPIDGSATNRPLTMSVLSVLTTAGVTADRLFHGKSNYPWIGDIAELVVYTEPLTSSQRKSVEDYLALKYATHVGTVGAPEFTPNGGAITDSVEVSLSSPTPNAEIRYTTDGSEPTDGSLLYAGPFTLSATTTVRARAFRSGMNPSAVALATFTKDTEFTPSDIPGLALWTRADSGVNADAAGRVSRWDDLSGQGNHLVQPTVVSRPVVQAGALVGLPVLRFDGSNDSLKFTTRLDGTIRAVFAVLKENPASTWRVFLGDTTKDDFAPGYLTWWGGASPSVTGGQMWVNGAAVSGTQANRPQVISVMSLLTTAGVTADRLFHGKSNYPWIGDIAELVIYTQPLTSSQRKSVEDYLALKYAAYVGTAGAPDVTPNGGTFTGSVEVTLASPTPGAEVRYTTDASEPVAGSPLYTGPFTLTATTLVQARAFRAGMNPSPVSLANFTLATDSSPANVPGLVLWARADVGVTSDGSGRVSLWRDLSGKGNDLAQATVASQPGLVPNAQASLPVVRFDGSDDGLLFKSRLTNIRTVFWVVREEATAPNGYRYLLGDASNYHFTSGAARQIWSSGYASPSVLSGETRVNGALVDGQITNRPTSLSVVSLVTTGAVTADAFSRDRTIAGRSWWGDLAELVVYDRPLTNAERQAVEEHLAFKYALYVPTLAPPEFTPNGATFTDSVEVSLTSYRPGAEIRYTTDGSEPTESSPLYTSPLVLTTSTMLQARAFQDGLGPSPVAVAHFSHAGDLTPASVPGLVLWARADVGVTSDGSGRVSVWRDVSGRGNDLAQTTAASQPSFVPGAQAGQPVVRFDGAGDTLLFRNRITTIRTVFWVVREEASAPNGYRHLLGDATQYHFYSGQTRQIWSSAYASPSVVNGETRLNGVTVDGRITNRPTSLSLLSLVTTADATADAFSRDRVYGASWWGDLAELVVYDRPLTSTERKAVEDHLAVKYALYMPTLSAPLFTPNGSSQQTPVSVAISAEPGTEIRFTTDGTEPVAASALYEEPLEFDSLTVLKARAFRAGYAPSPVTLASFLDTDTKAPLRVAGLKLWLKADTGVAVAGSSVSVWADQSGNANHLVQATAGNQPQLVPAAANGLPVLRFDGAGDSLAFTTRLTTIRSVFWVIRRSPAMTPGYRLLLGDSSAYHFLSDATTKLWNSGYTSASIRDGETRLNGALVNGVTTDRPVNLSLLSVVTTGDVSASSFSKDRGGDYSWWGDLAELVIFDRALSDSERQTIEGYLAEKWALYPPTVIAPLISPSGGRVSGPQLVQLGSATPGARVHYTLDDTEPTEASPAYSGGFEIGGSVRIRARAFRAGWNPSPETVVTFFDEGEFTPASLPGLSLWVRADAGLGPDGAGVWPDQSDSSNSLLQPGLFSRPSPVVDPTSRMPLLRFDGVDDGLLFTRALTGIRSVFWVIRRSPAMTPGYRMLLGDASVLDFCGDGAMKLWSSLYTNVAIKNGQTRLDGAPVNGTITDRPLDLSVVSVVTTGNVAADAFSRDRTMAGRSWWGDLAELVIFERALSPAEVQSIEAYLAGRYGIELAP